VWCWSRAARAARLPYQRKKLVLLFSAMRHYADKLQEQGYGVEILRAADMLSGLCELIKKNLTL
jgi:deoxyribodipyrimidine photolyase-related protein